jgi:hypothetical protein
MRHRFTVASAAYSDSREDELDDLRFMAGSPDNAWQWPADVLATRGAVQGQTINARPCLTINKLPQHVRLVTNEQRQNRPSGKVIPADDKADVAVAEVFQGIVRHIEYLSDAIQPATIKLPTAKVISESLRNIAAKTRLTKT